MPETQVLTLTRAGDRLALLRLAGAVRAAYDRSAMIYTDTDLAGWIDRWMTAHGHHVAIDVLPEGGLRFSDGDAGAWAAIRRATTEARFA